MTSGNPYKRPPHYFLADRRNPKYCDWCFLKETAPVHISTSIHEQEVYAKPERPNVDHLFKPLDSGKETPAFKVGFWCGMLISGPICVVFLVIMYQSFN